jgi:hypothetical protein
MGLHPGLGLSLGPTENDLVIFAQGLLNLESTAFSYFYKKVGLTQISERTK